MAFDIVGNRYFAFISWAFCVAALYAFIVNQSPPSFARAMDNELAGALELCRSHIANFLHFAEYLISTALQNILLASSITGIARPEPSTARP
jgi:hypothetical protein